MWQVRQEIHPLKDILPVHLILGVSTQHLHVVHELIVPNLPLSTPHERERCQVQTMGRARILGSRVDYPTSNSRHLALANRATVQARRSQNYYHEHAMQDAREVSLHFRFRLPMFIRVY